MGPTGRAIADALTAFDIGYAALDGDQKRLREAIADGYRVSFGELADPRIWEPIAMDGRRVSVLTEPSLEVSTRLTPVASRLFPNLKRIAVVKDLASAAQFASVGLTPVVEDGEQVGLASATAVLAMLEVEPGAIASWARSRELRETELQVA
jgi:Trk K+ transport system NAD-binding subunit